MNAKELAVTFQNPQSTYKKVFWFNSTDDRELFCNLVHGMIVSGTAAVARFKQLDTDQDGFLMPEQIKDLPDVNITSSTPVDISDFLIAHSNMQTDSKIRKDSLIDMSTRPTSMTTLVKHVSMSPQQRNDKKVNEPRLHAKEELLLKQTQTTRSVDGVDSHGVLYLTNFRISFYDYHKVKLNIDIPLACLKYVEKEDTNLTLHCKDYRQVKLGFHASSSWVNGLVQQLESFAFPKDQKKLFCFQYHIDTASTGVINGWDIYNPLKEYERLELSPKYGLRIVKENESYKISPTYPKYFVVPKQITKQEIEEVCAYRSKARIPATVWIHPKSHATLTRCAQPLAGVRARRSDVDEKLINQLREINKNNSSVLYIIDARPFKAAVGNSMMGKGYENTSNYENCKLMFLNIDNIHAIRSSMESIVELCYAEDDSQWLSRLEATQWLYYVQLILDSSDKMAAILEDEKASIVTHCSDGWDRTSQLVSITELLLDPYYRTLQGFIVLIEKEWLSFGHKFAERFGHADPNYSHDQRSPIFIQWLDVVFQIMHQFPLAFEFNEELLLEISEKLYSCRFGTFMYNNPKEREEANLEQKTVSLWTWVLHPKNRWKFVNFVYKPIQQERRLKPNTSPKALVLWEKLFMKYNLNWPKNWINSTNYELLRMRQKLEKMKAAMIRANVELPASDDEIDQSITSSQKRHLLYGVESKTSSLYVHTGRDRDDDDDTDEEVDRSYVERSVKPLFRDRSMADVEGSGDDTDTQKKKKHRYAKSMYNLGSRSGHTSPRNLYDEKDDGSDKSGDETLRFMDAPKPPKPPSRKKKPKNLRPDPPSPKKKSSDPSFSKNKGSHPSSPKNKITKPKQISFGKAKDSDGEKELEKETVNLASKLIKFTT